MSGHREGGNRAEWPERSGYRTTHDNCGLRHDNLNQIRTRSPMSTILSLGIW